MDWWTKFEGGGAEVLHLRPSRDQVAGDLLERRALHQRHCATVDARVRRSRRQCCLRRRANKSQPVVLRHYIPTGRVVSVLWGRGGGPQGVSGAQCGLRHDPRGGCAGS
jgi:hypothetical protein